VHSVNEKPSFEELEQRNARWARRIYFQEIPQSELSKSRERKVCVGDQNPLRIKLRIDITFTSVDEIQESNS
jgi:hypothetical protein